MAGDGPGARHESILAGAGRLPDTGSKLVDSRRVHKHDNRDNAPSIPSRADTSWEVAGRRAPPDRRRFVRGTPIRSTASSQSKPMPEQAAAPQPPDWPSRNILDRLPFCVNRNLPNSLGSTCEPDRENLSQHTCSIGRPLGGRPCQGRISL